MAWPSTVLPFPTRLNGEVIDASHLNGLQSEITTVEADLIAPWSTRAYSAANFSGSGGGTWVVEAGDFAHFAYKKIGKVVHVSFYLISTTITGAVNVLNQTVPYFPARSAHGVAFIDEGGVFSVGTVDVFQADTSVIRVLKPGVANFLVGANNLGVRGSITYETR